MKLYIYVLREHIWYFILGVLSLTLILLMNQIFLLIWEIIGKGVSLVKVAKILILYLPSIITLTIPMGVMVSSCMSFGRLSGDMEITGIRAAGINPLKLNILPFIVSIMIAVFLIWFNNHILPEANYKLKRLLIEISEKRPALRLKALVTIKEFPGYDMQIEKVDYKKEAIYGVKLFEKSTGKEIFAKYGYFGRDTMGIELILEEGEIHEPIGMYKYRYLQFSKYRLLLKSEEYKVKSKENRGDREISAKEIKERIKEYRVKDEKYKGYKDTEYKKRRINSLLVEYHKRYSLPCACIVFILLGCSLSIKIKKGAGVGFGLSLLFFIFYYVCLIGGESLGHRGKIPPWLAMWFANIVLFLLAIFYMSKVNR